jgi:hypothetical protein
MARLQILELPEGPDDSRPPFVLVVDGYAPRRYVLGTGQTGEPRSEFHGVAETIGARAILTFVEQVEIPANELLPEAIESRADGTDEVERQARQAEVKLKVYAEAQHERDLHLMDQITEALGFDRLRDWDEITAAARRLRENGFSGHDFGAPGYEDPLRCARCGIQRAEWALQREAPSCSTVLIRTGRY